MANADRYGIHRVLEPAGVLPQPAWKIDNSAIIASNEILIDVATLNVDSASFTQIKQQAGGGADQVADIILDIVASRGKLHNPQTGSGGMLIGTVAQIGADLQGHIDLQVGDRIATLVSLSLTPLRIDRITAVHMASDQVDIVGQAVLFESGLYAKLPDDMDQKLALAMLDVAGAPAQTARLARPGATVLIIGAGGKSGTLCVYEAKKQVGSSGCVIGLSPLPQECEQMRQQGWADVVLQLDARDAVSVAAAVAQHTQGKLADLVINCVNIPNTEMSSILATRDGGTVYFFSMATSFTAAALGAEGVGKDIAMLIGNGYAQGHGEYALGLLRENAVLRAFMEQRYARPAQASAELPAT